MRTEIKAGDRVRVKDDVSVWMHYPAYRVGDTLTVIQTTHFRLDDGAIRQMCLVSGLSWLPAGMLEPADAQQARPAPPPSAQQPDLSGLFRKPEDRASREVLDLVAQLAASALASALAGTEQAKPKPPMELGGTYRTRGGQIVRLTTYQKGSSHPWRGGLGAELRAWNENGNRFWLHDHPDDLVEQLS